MNCTNSCPKGLNPAKAIGSIKKCLQLAKSLFNQLFSTMKLIEHFISGKKYSGNSKRTGKVFEPATGDQKAECLN